jgi:hypothetical protein
VPNRTCTMPGCERKHIAKDLCQYHYNLKNYPGRAKFKIIEIPCGNCGVVMMKPRRSDRTNQFCSTDCRGAFVWRRSRERKVLVHVGPAPLYREIPSQHPVRQPIARRPRRVFVMGPCDWCGDAFLIIDQLQARFCSTRCAKQKANAARGDRFRIAPKIRVAIYERDDWICQLCGDPVDPTLHYTDSWSATLDHIECQSWALIPDHSPSNLRLAHRWCNSVRSDETYYTAADLVAS